VFPSILCHVLLLFVFSILGAGPALSYLSKFRGPPQFNEDWSKDNGVKQVSIPKRGKVGKERCSYQKQSWFKRLQRFRAGIETKVSLLKRKFGLKRSRLRGSPGANIWAGQGIFAHNLWQAARIA